MFECEKWRLELVTGGSRDAVQYPWMDSIGGHLKSGEAQWGGVRGRGGAEAGQLPRKCHQRPGINPSRAQLLKRNG